MKKHFFLTVVCVVAFVFYLETKTRSPHETNSISETKNKLVPVETRQPTSVGPENVSDKISSKTKVPVPHQESRNNERISEILNISKQLNPDERTIATQQKLLSELRASPTYFNDLLRAYQKTDLLHTVEAAGLLELMAERSEHSREVNQLAEGVLNQTHSEEVPLPKEAQTEKELDRALSTDPSMILPIVAHEVFLKTTLDDNLRFDGTVRAIKNQGNHNVRSALFLAYANTNPTRSEDLREELRRLNIPMAN